MDMNQLLNLTAENFAQKISHDYAQALRSAMVSAANRTFRRVDDFIDQAVKLQTLIECAQNEDKANGRIDALADQIARDVELDMADTRQDVDQRFDRMIQQYRIAQNPFAGDVGPVFEGWAIEGWVNPVDMIKETDILPQICPKLYRKGHISENSDFDLTGNESAAELASLITAGIGDLLSVKKNFKKLCRNIYADFLDSLPTSNELQQKAYERIIAVAIKYTIEHRNAHLCRS